MRKIGLTGSIACGKTTVSDHLRSCGFPVVDGDQLARELTTPGSPVLDEIRRHFGSHYVSETGSLNRRALGQLVFHDEIARAKLDQLMAPHLRQLTMDRIHQYESSGTPICFLDMPLLFEKGYDRLCDSVWTVWIPLPLQLDRLMNRDGYSREDAMARINSVMSSDEKASRSNQVIDNSGSVAQTLSMVDRLVEEELNRKESASSRRNDSFPFPSYVSVPERSIMDRPKAARQKLTEKKATWQLPSWAAWSLSVLAVLVLFSGTMYFLKSARLSESRKAHMEEQEQILNYYHYPVEFYRDNQLKDKTAVFLLAEQYAAEFNLQPALVIAVIRNESSFNSRAESSIGARGLMQLKKDTAEWIAGKLKIQGYTFDMMWEPAINIRFGCWYLNYLSNLFDGDPVCVISAYHAGQGNVRTWLSSPACSDDGRTMELDRIPTEDTKLYAKRVTRDYGIYQKLLYPATQSAGNYDDHRIMLLRCISR